MVLLRNPPSLRLALSALFVVACAGCSAPVQVERIRETSNALTVGEAAAQMGCSTSIVAGLSQQILDEVQCNNPTAIAPVPDRPNLVKGAAVFAYLEPPARDALLAALDANPNTTMTVNSMMRTVAAQYLLYQWMGSCGISIAASPGSSNHETGLAIDVDEHDAWITALEANHFTWYGAGDAVHFDYTGPGTTDIRSEGVLAFQKLWNRNNPGDLIDEDGIYGPQTGARISQSPTDGFALGAMCSGGTGGAGGVGGAGTGGSSTGATAGVSGSAGTAGSSGSPAAGAAGESGTAGSSQAGSSSGGSSGGSATGAGGSNNNGGSGGNNSFELAIDDSDDGSCAVHSPPSKWSNAAVAVGAMLWLIGRVRRKPRG